MPLSTEYTYHLLTGWQPQASPRLLPHFESTPDALEALGYTWINESAQSDCGVGHFYLLQREVPDPAWPRYAAHLTQWGDEAVVWLHDLPTLLEWLRLYATIPVVLHRQRFEDDAEDEEEPEAPRCPDCGEPMSLVPALTVVKRQTPDRKSVV